MPQSVDTRAPMGGRATGTVWVRGALQRLLGDAPDLRRGLRTPEEVSPDEAAPIITRLTQAFKKYVDPQTGRTAFAVQTPALILDSGTGLFTGTGLDGASAAGGGTGGEPPKTSSKQGSSSARAAPRRSAHTPSAAAPAAISIFLFRVIATSYFRNARMTGGSRIAAPRITAASLAGSWISRRWSASAGAYPPPQHRTRRAAGPWMPHSTSPRIRGAEEAAPPNRRWNRCSEVGTPGHPPGWTCRTCRCEFPT